MSAPATLLDVRDLRVGFGSPDRAAPAVDGVSFHIGEGETVALVGESGSGKSVTALALTRLVPTPPGVYAGGQILFRGQPVLALDEPGLRRLRGREIAYVFQEPAVALNPVLRTGFQVGEAVRLHQPGAPVEAETLRLLGLVGLPDPARVARAYPHELSGGMQQRALIAMALAGRPRLLVADEPTTALDVTVQAQIIDLLLRLQADLGMALLLITHNLGLVARAAHRVYVMYAGHIVEEGPCVDVLRTPRHPYTEALLRAVPTLQGGSERLAGIPGSVPAAGMWPSGCRFHPRCPKAQGRCVADAPAWEQAGEGGVRCHFWR
jgi:oligopeptide/dipeptide ABC transporter ATP-binding protein